MLGDIVALGPDPVGVLERLTALPERDVRPREHRSLRRHRRAAAADASTRPVADPDLVRVVAEVAGSFAWTAGCLARDRLDRVAGRAPDRAPPHAARRHARARRSTRRRCADDGLGIGSQGGGRRARRPARRLRRRRSCSVVTRTARSIGMSRRRARGEPRERRAIPSRPISGRRTCVIDADAERIRGRASPRRVRLRRRDRRARSD